MARESCTGLCHILAQWDSRRTLALMRILSYSLSLQRIRYELSLLRETSTKLKTRPAPKVLLAAAPSQRLLPFVASCLNKEASTGPNGN